MKQAAVLQSLRTPRLTLRPLRPDDRQAIVDGVGNYDVSRWLSVVPYPYALSDADAFISDVLSGSRPVRAICDESGLVGTISTAHELGYWLARPAWGKGYATEAGDAMTDAFFADPEAQVLPSCHFVGNTASAAVLRKLGFVPNGKKSIDALALSQQVSAVTMILTRADWEARRSFHIATQRLEIREVRDADWPDLQRLGGVPEVARMLLSVEAPWPEAHVRQWIARAPYRGRPGFRATIRLKRGPLRSAPVIGSLGIGRNPGAPGISCYYWLGREHWGKGYATEAMRAFLAECYRRFPELDAIDAAHFVDNPASGHVLRKLGFRSAGQGMGASAARLEPAPELHYRLGRATFEASP